MVLVSMTSISSSTQVQAQQRQDLTGQELEALMEYDAYPAFCLTHHTERALESNKYGWVSQLPQRLIELYTGMSLFSSFLSATNTSIPYYLLLIFSSFLPN